MYDSKEDPLINVHFKVRVRGILNLLIKGKPCQYILQYTVNFLKF